MHRFSGDVIPIGASLIVDEQHKAVEQAARAKVQVFSVDCGSQTDRTVANRSIRYEIGFPRQFALGTMMVSEFGLQKGAPHATALDDKQFVVGVELALGKRDTFSSHIKADEHIGATQPGAGGVKFVSGQKKSFGSNESETLKVEGQKALAHDVLDPTNR